MMGKIKLNLVSGAVVEKPLINAFKANNNSYVVFDNEMNGSMGLPIILVCKFENNKLTKIIDQNEWQIVKEYLKNIIAGNQIEFISVENELAADDIYYTQLTLPVPSFDALKNAYKVENNTIETNVMDVNVEPIVNVQPEVVAPVQEQVVVDTPQVSVEPVIAPSEPVINISVPEPEVVAAPVEETSSVAPAIDINVQMPNPSVVEPVVSVTEPEITPTPVIDTVISENVNTSELFKEQKEAFMLACENMFDALVQKFEKELENRK